MPSPIPLLLRRLRSPAERSRLQARGRRRGAAAALALAPAAVLFVLACTGDGLTRPEPAAAGASGFWALELSDHAVTLSTTAPYDTVRLTAVPRNVRGEAIAGLPAPRFISLNTDQVQVTSDGVLIARAPTAQLSSQLAMVVTDLTADNLRHADTVLVKVVDDPAPPVLTSFSVQPVPPDSAKIDAIPRITYNFTRLPVDLRNFVHATDANGQPIADVLTEFHSSDPEVAEIFPAGYIYTGGFPGLIGLKPGVVTIHARTNVFGVVKSDSLRFEVTLPLWAIVDIVPGYVNGQAMPVFAQSAARIARGGFVGWSNPTFDSVDVLFSDPTDVVGLSTSAAAAAAFWCGVMQFSTGEDCATPGNLTLPPRASQESFPPFKFRAFSAPGTYTYQTAKGATGKVIVE